MDFDETRRGLWHQHPDVISSVFSDTLEIFGPNEAVLSAGEYIESSILCKKIRQTTDFENNRSRILYRI